MLRLARNYGVECVGGDITKSRDVFLSITLTGECHPSGPILRSGARHGDLLAVTGTLGGSIRGRHLTFEPRVKEGLFLAGGRYARAMIDISDGSSFHAGLEGRGTPLVFQAAAYRFFSFHRRRLNFHGDFL